MSKFDDDDLREGGSPSLVSLLLNKNIEIFKSTIIDI